MNSTSKSPSNSNTNSTEKSKSSNSSSNSNSKSTKSSSSSSIFKSTFKSHTQSKLPLPTKLTFVKPISSSNGFTSSIKGSENVSNGSSIITARGFDVSKLMIDCVGGGCSRNLDQLKSNDNDNDSNNVNGDVNGGVNEDLGSFSIDDIFKGTKKEVMKAKLRINSFDKSDKDKTMEDKVILPVVSMDSSSSPSSSSEPSNSDSDSDSTSSDSEDDSSLTKNNITFNKRLSVTTASIITSSSSSSSSSSSPEEESTSSPSESTPLHQQQQNNIPQLKPSSSSSSSSSSFPPSPSLPSFPEPLEPLSPLPLSSPPPPPPTAVTVTNKRKSSLPEQQTSLSTSTTPTPTPAQQQQQRKQQKQPKQLKPKQLNPSRPRLNSTDGELKLPRHGLCLEDDILITHRWLPPTPGEGRVGGGGGKGGIGPGFNNLGNTCFLNATLQCLCYCPSFAQCVSFVGSNNTTNTNSSSSSSKGSSKGQGNSERSKVCNGEIGAIMGRLIDRVHTIITNKNTPNNTNTTNTQQKPRSSISPKEIVTNLRTLSKSFRLGRQEDAHEFLVHLLSTLQTEELSSHKIDTNLSGWRDKLRLTRLDETTCVSRMFGGYFRSQVGCSKCGYKSNTYDPFLDLALDISKGNVNSIKSALDSFCKIETLDKDNKWRCPKCSKAVQATKCIHVYRPPLTLCIQLKRFSYAAGANKGKGGKTSGKIGKSIEFPSVLDLPLSDGRKCKYNLNGIVVHDGGGLGSGHYYSYVCGVDYSQEKESSKINSKNSNGSSSSDKKKWYKLDDSTVYSCTLNDVLKRKDAYLLFYTRAEVVLELPVVPNDYSSSSSSKEGTVDSGEGKEGKRARKGSEVMNVVVEGDEEDEAFTVTGTGAGNENVNENVNENENENEKSEGEAVNILSGEKKIKLNADTNKVQTTNTTSTTTTTPETRSQALQATKQQLPKFDLLVKGMLETSHPFPKPRKVLKFVGRIGRFDRFKTFRRLVVSGVNFWCLIDRDSDGIDDIDDEGVVGYGGGKRKGSVSDTTDDVKNGSGNKKIKISVGDDSKLINELPPPPPPTQPSISLPIKKTPSLSSAASKLEEKLRALRANSSVGVSVGNNVVVTETVISVSTETETEIKINTDVTATATATADVTGATDVNKKSKKRKTTSCKSNLLLGNVKTSSWSDSDDDDDTANINDNNDNFNNDTNTNNTRNLALSRSTAQNALEQARLHRLKLLRKSNWDASLDEGKLKKVKGKPVIKGEFIIDEVSAERNPFVVAGERLKGGGEGGRRKGGLFAGDGRDRNNIGKDRNNGGGRGDRGGRGGGRGGEKGRGFQSGDRRQR